MTQSRAPPSGSTAPYHAATPANKAKAPIFSFGGKAAPPPAKKSFFSFGGGAAAKPAPVVKKSPFSFAKPSGGDGCNYTQFVRRVLPLVPYFALFQGTSNGGQRVSNLRP